MTYGYLKPQKSSSMYVPKIFGFKIRDQNRSMNDQGGNHEDVFEDKMHDRK